MRRIVCPIFPSILLILTVLLAADAWAADSAETPFTVFRPAEQSSTAFVAAAGPDELLAFEFTATPVRDVFDYIAKSAEVNVVVDPGIDDIVDVRVVGVTADRALSCVARTFGGAVRQDDFRIYYITKPPTITMEYEGADIRQVVKDIAAYASGNVVLSEEVQGEINMRLAGVSWRDALDAVVDTAGFVLVEEESGILRVATLASLIEHRETKVFPLHYVQPPDVYRAAMESEFLVGGPDEPSGILSFSGIGSTTGGEVSRATRKQFTLVSTIASALSPVGTVEFDPASNTLIVTDIRPRLVEIERLVRMVDRRPAQVFVDVKFVSTEATDLLDFGMDFVGSFQGATENDGFRIAASGGSVATILPFNRGKGGWEDWLGAVDDGPPAVRFDDIAGVVPGGSFITPAIAGSSYQYGTMNFDQFSMIFQMFKQDLFTRVIQAPKILTLDNQAATIFVGRTVRYAEAFSQTNEAGGVEAGIREATNSPVATGMQLLVIPHVVPGTDEIIIDVIPEEDALTGTGSIPGFDDFTAGTSTIQLPRVSSRTIVTRMRVRSGQTIVLGGLVDERTTVSDRRIPFLSELPGVGYLFKNQISNRVKSNLLIFMTCVIVRNASDLERIHTVHRDYEGGYLNDIETSQAQGGFGGEVFESAAPSADAE